MDCDICHGQIKVLHCYGAAFCCSEECIEKFVERAEVRRNGTKTSVSGLS
jgi:hypothetical protein